MAEENENETETETNPMAALVQHALDQDYNNANKVFGDIMGTRINDVLDQEKIKLSNQVYNGIEPEEGDETEDDEQLELDLADEEGDDEEDQEVEDDEVEYEEDEEDEEDEDEEDEEELDAHDG
jgi:hypothetical protein|tara:strand:- start:798 stop:1169 length:372 start_codon:yes stop_codon:yes gene_type:complete